MVGKAGTAQWNELLEWLLPGAGASCLSCVGNGCGSGCTDPAWRGLGSFGAQILFWMHGIAGTLGIGQPRAFHNRLSRAAVNAPGSLAESKPGWTLGQPEIMEGVASMAGGGTE